MDKSDTENKRLLSTKEVAARYGLAEITLVKWRQRGEGPAWVQLGRRIAYKIEDLEAYLQANTVYPEAANG